MNLIIMKQEIGTLIEVINELKKSSEFTKSFLEDKVSKFEQNFCKLQGKL